jgi:Rrf2 family protein
MKLSTKSEYACLALIDLSENYGAEYIKIEDICQRQNLPRKYIEQILLSLKRAGYVKSRRGSEGGYMLFKKPEDISLAEVVRLMDGALAPVNSVSKYFYESSPLEKNDALITVFREIRDYISDKMENTSFADVIAK